MAVAKGSVAKELDGEVKIHIGDLHTHTYTHLHRQTNKSSQQLSKFKHPSFSKF